MILINDNNKYNQEKQEKVDFILFYFVILYVLVIIKIKNKISMKTQWEFLYRQNLAYFYNTKAKGCNNKSDFDREFSKEYELSFKYT